MRERFPWYFVDQEDYDAAWKEGILTVDANVMLDLYRYNTLTREALLIALESFKGRFWISHQTAKEFLKNRLIVITDINNEFKKANVPVNKVEDAVRSAFDAIRGCRSIPKEFSDQFQSESLKACKNIREAIEKEKSEIPNFAKKDEVLKRIEEALEGRVGVQPNDIEEDLKEAKRRRDEQIPPGYMDDKKDGLGFAGDYLMWKQILSHGEGTKAPMILVTSETKEDWWDKKSGKTLGARLELLQEAFEEMGQKILICHTDNFLRIHQERTGASLDETVLEEIRDYSLAREPAVSVVHVENFADTASNKGKLRITIARPVRNFTGTGRFGLVMREVPELTAKLIEAPDDALGVIVRANTGTTYNFNVHVHSKEHGEMLPVGDYLLEYEASCNAQAEDTEREESAE